MPGLVCSAMNSYLNCVVTVLVVDDTAAELHPGELQLLTVLVVHGENPETLTPLTIVRFDIMVK